jgi:hypothetical protein
MKLKEILNLNENQLKSFDDLEVGSIYRISHKNDIGQDITADYKYDGVDGKGSLNFTLVKHYLDKDTLKRYEKLGLDWNIGKNMWTGRAGINRHIQRREIKKIK